MPKISSIRPVVSIQYGLVTDRQTDRPKDRHAATAYAALTWRRAGKQEKISVLVLFLNR